MGEPGVSGLRWRAGYSNPIDVGSIWHSRAEPDAPGV
ncbi:MAG: hypothetical protein H6Q90_5858, partial [Deltaproteobacteria bacterium]|nr:hypothetical protein [Deltaproteobacteria bacterium]